MWFIHIILIMYDYVYIYTPYAPLWNIYPTYHGIMVHVGKYSIHGASGYSIEQENKEVSIHSY